MSEPKSSTKTEFRPLALWGLARLIRQECASLSSLSGAREHPANHSQPVGRQANHDGALPSPVVPLTDICDLCGEVENIWPCEACGAESCLCCQSSLDDHGICQTCAGAIRKAEKAGRRVRLFPRDVNRLQIVTIEPEYERGCGWTLDARDLAGAPVRLPVADETEIERGLEREAEARAEGWDEP